MGKNLQTAGIILAVSLAVPSPAQSQAWIGQIAGEVAAQEQQALQETACRKGAPADPSDVKSSNRRAEKLMDSYFALTSKSTKRDIQRVFAMDKPDMSWKDASGKVPPDQLGARLDETSTERTLVLSVVGGDNKTLRAIWSVGDGADKTYYAADIIIGSWFEAPEIWHMTVSPTLPDTPPAYCHFDTEQSF
jgi:hypothetical protein